MKNKLLFLLISASFFATGQTNKTDLPLIPLPVSIVKNTGTFTLNESTTILADYSIFETQYLQDILNQRFNITINVVSNSNPIGNQIILKLDDADKSLNDSNAYNLTVDANQIKISSKSKTGLFYGIQTLLLLLPVNNSKPIRIEAITIKDAPKYNWRGMHLDVCRHFFPKEFVKKYIDYLAMYKMNTFHWHLTDDQGWRIEIKKYPKLTDVGAWRKGSMVGHYNEQRFDTLTYGGYYTQEEIKEIVAYAQQRHITIVPEIEMPGHAMAAIAAYPEYSCTGGPFTVEKSWGVFDDVFCAKDETFNFLQDVLTEVMELFPSQYIHVGGDECPKTRWEKCPNCQSVMKRNGLKDEHELQSYFITRIEKFVNSKGRKIIGWDEILEGGLAPNAAVMSWRGTEGGIAAAKQKHFVVMTPGSHCYFDHYQGEPKCEPISIGGNTTVEKVYSYQPTPKELTPTEGKYILGAQGNLWTEYISTTSHVEYMALPRMAALAEVVWGTADSKYYNNFQNRLTQHFALLDQKGINYSKSIFQVTSRVSANPNSNGVMVQLKSAFDSSEIYYSLNDQPLNAQANKYLKPFPINESTRIRAAHFENGIQKSLVYEQTITVSKSTGKKITLVAGPNGKYATGGAFTLINGVCGDSIRRSGDWIGFRPDDINATVDLGSTLPISVVKINFLKDEGSWIHYPKSVVISYSTDGVKYSNLTTINANEIKASRGRVNFKMPTTNARYIKIKADNLGKIPPGMPGSGSYAWLFADEIFID